MEASVNMRDRRSLTLSNATVTLGDSTLLEGPYQNDNEMQTLHDAFSLPVCVVGDDSKRRQHPRPRHQRAGWVLILLCAVATLWRAVYKNSFPPTTMEISGSESLHTSNNSAAKEMPSILKIADSHHDSRWTVQIPENYSFPLRGNHAQAICKHAEAFSESSGRQSRLTSPSLRLRKPTYYSKDESFVEIEEAERVGILQTLNKEERGEVCKKSLTFVLDQDDDSFGRSLLLLWLSYGLAQKEGRAFFIDDTRWAYGRYISYFAPPPRPQCASPPPQHIMPCPHSVKHLTVSSATMHWTFGNSFEEQFVRPRRGATERSHHIFDLLRHGYHDLFHLSGELALYAMSRIAKFKEEATGGPIVGIHIRRGNLHPHEAQFSQDYIPPERYGEVARSLLQSLQQRAHNRNDERKQVAENIDLPLLLATDDPEMFDSGELKQSVLPLLIQKAQERVELTTKSTLDLLSPAEPIREPGTPFQYIYENSGLEGGFFPCSEAVQQKRELIGRAHVLDLAVLSASDGIVCGIASSTCRILAVMLGWAALEEERWVNVDRGSLAWSWNGK